MSEIKWLRYKSKILILQLSIHGQRKHLPYIYYPISYTVFHERIFLQMQKAQQQQPERTASIASTMKTTIPVVSLTTSQLRSQSSYTVCLRKQCYGSPFFEPLDPQFSKWPYPTAINESIIIIFAIVDTYFDILSYILCVKEVVAQLFSNI